MDPAGSIPTIFTAMFMHAGWLHLGGNMLYLWIFGDNIEDRLGPIKFLIFYLVCGIAATLAQYYVSPGSRIPNVGASGAIAGILGAYLLLFPRARVRVLLYNQIVAMPALAVLGFWIVLQIFAGAGALFQTAQSEDVGGVAYMAHVGGFLAGFLIAVLTLGRGPREQR
jgi:membrane associated rhomboid family serine protease